jgi:hypothetical protein
MGRVTAFALVALTIDAVLARSSFASIWAVAPLVILPPLVAIRVARGFPYSLTAAIVTFVSAGVLGLALPARALVSVALLGVVAAVLAVQRETRTPTIELTRTNRDGPEPVTARR